jgi:hypothetical protein
MILYRSQTFSLCWRKQTTALDRLSAYLRERGFRVFTVTEAATLMFSSGCYFSDMSPEAKSITFQAQLMGIQLSLEDAFIDIARATGVPCVVLCDRGACDGKAYSTPEAWEQVRAKRGFESDVPLREGRYSAVFHLVTAALGAEKFYTLANNETRTETLEQARTTDERTQRAWMGHPRLTIFDNEGKDFEAKMRRVVDTMAMIVGLPLVERTPTKFLLAPIPTAVDVPGASPETDGLATFLRHRLTKGESGGCGDGEGSTSLAADPLQVFEVEKIYLLGSQQPLSEGLSLQYSFIRRRSQKTNSTYGHTTVSLHSSGERVEVKRIMTKREFEFMKATLTDPKRHVVLQRRYCFLWAGKSFSIHRYLEPSTATCILHCQSEWAPKDPLSSSADDEKDVDAATAAASASTEPTETGAAAANPTAPTVDDADEAAAASSKAEAAFPPFLRVDSPLKSDGEFSAYNLSLKDKKPPTPPLCSA